MRLTTIGLVLSAAAGLGACATPPAAALPAGDQTTGPCGAEIAARFTGKVATAEVRGELAKAVGHDRIRWIGPLTPVTMDYSEARLNVMLDNKDRIVQVRCG